MTRSVSTERLLTSEDQGIILCGEGLGFRRFFDSLNSLQVQDSILESNGSGGNGNGDPLGRILGGKVARLGGIGLCLTYRVESNALEIASPGHLSVNFLLQ